YEHQGYTIEYGSQYFQTFIPVCLAVIGNLLSEFESHKCNSKRDCITEHVACIREQCETARKPSADRFNNHESCNDYEIQEKSFYIGTVRVIMMIVPHHPHLFNPCCLLSSSVPLYQLALSQYIPMLSSAHLYR